VAAIIACVGATGALTMACRKSEPGKTILTEPSQCKTSLLETTSCRGEDTSFQECHYFLRAEGVPRPEVCRAFLAKVTNARSGPANPDAGHGECSEVSPADWRRVPCSDYQLAGDLACLSCVSERHEAARTLVQAFTPACDRAIVLKGCNVDLTKVSFPVSK
jgi:hypothetical protein